MKSMIKKELFDELLSHLEGSQGNDLKSLLAQMEAKEKPGMEESESPEMQALEDASGVEEHDEMGKPKGIAIEKISVGKPDELAEAAEGDQDEMSDDELSELLKKYLS